jgi:hypothetical protein
MTLPQPLDFAQTWQDYVCRFAVGLVIWQRTHHLPEN